MTEQPKIIFLHIEKAGGSTLHNILSNFYEPKSVLHLEYMRDGKKEIEQADVSALRLVKGHNVYGAHRYLGDEWKYYSMLRNPVDRVVSYFYYVRQKKSHHHSELIREKNWDLSAYLQEAQNLQMDNGQVRYISGSEKPFGQMNREDLELAKSNIEKRFLTVGLTERFDESLLLLKKELDWKSMPIYEKANVNTKKEKNLSAGELELIRKYNELDEELFAFVSSIFEKKVEENREYLQQELKALQKATRIYYLKKRIRKFISPKKKGLR